MGQRHKALRKQDPGFSIASSLPFSTRLSIPGPPGPQGPAGESWGRWETMGPEPRLLPSWFLEKSFSTASPPGQRVPGHFLALTSLGGSLF